MDDRWGEDGPPDEAYSRVTRDVAEVTAGLGRWAEALPARLVETYDAVTREPTDEERALVTRSGVRPDVRVVEPSDPAASRVVIATSQSEEWGWSVTLGLGRLVVETVPTCLCDACDEESEDLVEMLEEQYLDAATQGFVEFRKRQRRTSGWMEHGFRWADGGSSSAPRPGPAFEQSWAAWPVRRP
ncbi:hypothetical protein ASD11_15735 [Aeromicrobium sp. Root495]|uniref:DUF6226 family protein n=1 Tax=Aeromicrobium sp. Root495 TaxID=1736550 RepID=UPI0006F3020E|nr:DUF6226 family protein [Aeromicrobium sp. Root495]KQY55937.1 hypothetical protein ASD11_15735 [Aeromicrobium sp. Root495]